MKTYLLKKNKQNHFCNFGAYWDTLSLLREKSSVWLMGISKNRLYATSSRSGNGFSFSHKRDCRIT